MSEDTKQLIVVTTGFILFLVLFIGALTYNSSMSNDTRRICLQVGNVPEECGM